MSEGTHDLPPGWLAGNELDAGVPPGISNETRQLSEGILCRNIARAQQATDLVGQQGADPNVQPQLRMEGTTAFHEDYPLLSLCIDNLTEYRISSISAADGDDRRVPVALPLWRTRGLQEGVMRSLIEEGADINAIPTDEDGDDCPGATPVRVAIASCNETAFRLLMTQDGLQLHGREVLDLPATLETDKPTEDHEATLLSFYQQLLDRAPTLAAETDARYSGNPVHWVAFTRPVWSQSFIDSYLDLLVANGADMTAVDDDGWTPLHCAAYSGSHRVAASLCRRLTATDINRGRFNDPSRTPLSEAARRLDDQTQLLDDDTTEAADKDEATSEIPHLKSTILVLLQAGANIARLRTATERDRRRRRLVLTEYATVLNEVPIAAMSAINAALRPQRELAALLTCALPQMTKIQLDTLFPRQPCPSPSPQPTNTIEQGTSESPADGDSDCAASLQVAGNQQVVGSRGSKKRDSQGQMKRGPPLQCFVPGGVSGRRLGVREVVHRARLDEAAQHGVEGVVKGFNTHLGDSDCQFQWQQLGYVGSGGGFESLAAAFQPPAGPSDSEASDDSSEDDLNEGEESDGGEGSASGVGDASDEGEGHGDDDDMMEEE
ncbi:unnamed protein product [Vitrella brassicaformis CCMP3155]|uniref:Uncharacterized protein n=1 Tax=Vitrella brassicaformis (strain CCMP3155) TaxID=1169540 RepID=A0A0G4EWT8_VITBC|nr:unnamed protein product [Vitrella brassicaformis CCMP3155]|eukprot:CEM03228.1 unnamed protein product [Vitrella brassicaformis CCMP3155]